MENTMRFLMFFGMDQGLYEKRSMMYSDIP